MKNFKNLLWTEPLKRLEGSTIKKPRVKAKEVEKLILVETSNGNGHRFARLFHPWNLT